MVIKWIDSTLFSYLSSSVCDNFIYLFSLIFNFIVLLKDVNGVIG